MIENDRESDLRSLESYVKNDAHGFASHQFYRMLRTKYPFSFVALLKKYNKPKSNELGLLEWLKEVELRIKKAEISKTALYEIFSNYMISPPLSDYQKNEFILTIERLDRTF